MGDATTDKRDEMGPLSSGTPKQVFEHCLQPVRDIGPTGCILQSGCDIPVDAPLANVKAMADAADAAAG